MERRHAPNYRRAQQQLADMHEDLELNRWRRTSRTRLGMLRVVDEAARRADILARLDYELLHRPPTSRRASLP